MEKRDKLDLLIQYGDIAYFLNERLLDKQRCWSNLEKIKEAHLLRLAVVDLMSELNEVKDEWILREYASDITEIDFYLQELWKFPKDARYHQFWNLPKCMCPKMDNEDSYPYTSYISSGCILHSHLMGVTKDKVASL